MLLRISMFLPYIMKMTKGDLQEHGRGLPAANDPTAE